MPLWMWLVDSLVVIVALGIVLIAGLALRRRWISRKGVVFELSVNHGAEHSAKGWMLGVAVYRDDVIEWYRTFSYSPRPRHRFHRGEVLIEGRRMPEGDEAYALHDGHVIVTAHHADGVRQFALSPSLLTGMLSWLESSPPGRGVNNVL